VTKEGVEGDYNHYRTVALKSTEDRTVSILTMDVMNSIHATYKNYKPKEGDLGENILVDGVPFGFFRVGQRYLFESSSKNQDASDDVKERVVVEITEPIEPCANLCKLPYINDETISPKERIERCKDFIDHLDRFDGYRGWYAKVNEAGVIRTGSLVSIVQKEKQ
jgi:MOSC domain-containing protein YiiM